MRSSLITRVVTLASLLVGAFAFSALAATWTAPTVPAPGGNPDAPINVGSLLQNKLGWLGVKGLVTTDLTLATGTPSAGMVLTALDSLGNAGWATPAASSNMRYGSATLACASYQHPTIGTVTVTFSPVLSSAPSAVIITPNWTNYSGDEAPSWWVSNVTASGFKINVQTTGENHCSDHPGTADKVFWAAMY
jgi:hypothetical protein